MKDLCNECYKINTTNNAKENSLTDLNSRFNNEPFTSTPSNENSHQKTHPMQIVLTELYFESCRQTENVYFMDRPSFTCPYCAKTNFNILSLCDHLTSNHSDDARSSLDSIPSTNMFSQNAYCQLVTCPICVAISASGSRNSNQLIKNLLKHVKEIHLGDRSENNNQSLNISTTTFLKGRFLSFLKILHLNVRFFAVFQWYRLPGLLMRQYPINKYPKLTIF